MPDRTTRQRRRGTTLIELVAVLPAMALITGVVGGAVILVARSADRGVDESVRIFGGANALRRVASDVAGALAFSELSATALEFRVPDRTGNGREDVLRYSWSGVAGDPLLYRLNQQPPGSVLDDVHALTFTPEIMTDALEPLDEELAVIAHHDRALGSHPHGMAIEPLKWCAQYFEPDLPPSTTSWTLKRVRFMAESADSDVTAALGIRIESATLGQKPSGIALEKATVPEARLDTEPGWVEVDFTSLNALDPAEGLCLVISHESGPGKSGTVTYEHADDPMTAGTHWLKTGDGGGTWSDIVNDKDLRFYVLGNYDTWVPTPTSYVVGVRLQVQAGPSSDAAVERMAGVLNAVELDP